MENNKKKVSEIKCILIISLKCFQKKKLKKIKHNLAPKVKSPVKEVKSLPVREKQLKFLDKYLVPIIPVDLWSLIEVKPCFKNKEEIDK